MQDDVDIVVSSQRRLQKMKIMMTDEEYVDFLEENRFTIVKHINPEVFTDKLRSQRYLSDEDTDEIGNLCRFTTRRQRADYERHRESRISQDLDALTRAGFQYANLKWEKKDLAYQVENLQKMLEYAEKENKDLEREVQMLRPYQTLIRQLQEKVADSDREIRNLKDENRDLLKRNIHYRDEEDHQKSRVENLLIDRDNLEKRLSVATSELQRMNQSQDVLRERFEEARKESQRFARLATQRGEHQRIPKQESDLASTSCHRCANTSAKQDILQCDLDAERENNKELCVTLEDCQEELLKERRSQELVQRELLKVRKDRDQCQLWLKHAERNNEQYFKAIQELEKEKRKAEEEKILAQQKCWEVEERRQFLFVAKHDLERKYDKLLQEFQQFKQNLRESQTSFTLSPTQEKTFGLLYPGTYASVTQLEDPFLGFDASIKESVGVPDYSLNSYSILPAAMKWNTTDESHLVLRERSSLNTSSPFKYGSAGPAGALPVIPPKSKVTPTDSLLVNPSSSVKGTNKQHLAFLRLPGESHAFDDSHPVCRSFDYDDSKDDDLGFVMEKLPYVNSGWSFKSHTTTSSSGSSDQPDTEAFEVCWHIIRQNSPSQNWLYESVLASHPEHTHLKQLQDASGDMQSHTNADEHAGAAVFPPVKNVYLRCNITWEDKELEGSIPIKEGEILFITDSVDDTYFHASKVIPNTGCRMKKTVIGLIPNRSKAKAFCRRMSSQGLLFPPELKTESKLLRRTAIRKTDQNPYSLVLPMEAKMQLPVLLYGVPSVVSAVLDLIAENSPEWAVILPNSDPDSKIPVWKDLIHADKHVIIPGWSKHAGKSLHKYIILTIKLMGEEYRDLFRDIFDRDLKDDIESESVVVRAQEMVHQKAGLHCESLSLPSQKVRDGTSLLAVIGEKIKKAQGDIFWIEISWP